MEDLSKKLGRVFIPDDRDKMFQLKTLLPQKAPEITYKYWWSNGWTGNQGNTPQCVAYSWTHWLAAGPIVQYNKKDSKSIIDPTYLYDEAQKVDEWLGEDYDGTSVRAGAKILKQNGFILSYNWAWDIETIILTLLTKGPLVVGTVWTYDMFFPDKKGLIKASGNEIGGHAYLLDGINKDKELIRIKNSWGRDWGKNGFAYISFNDMSKLISMRGEACLAIEILK